MKNTIKWVAGVAALVWSIKSLFDVHLISTLLFFIAALFILPPSIKSMEAKNGKQNPAFAYWVLFGIFFFLGMVFAKKSDDPVPVPQEQPIQPASQIANACACKIQPLYNDGAVENRGGNVWISVSGFDSKNKGCFDVLRKYARSNSLEFKRPVTFHFLDSLPNFQPPGDGRHYGGIDVQNRLILLYQVFQNGEEFFLFDNFGTGKYVEPQ